MLEATFWEEVKAALEGAGCMPIKIHGHGMQKAGLPDVQVYSPRWTGHIELKVEDDTSTLQKLTMVDLLVRGTPALVLRWVGGHVQAETHEGDALGYIPASVWGKRPQRSLPLMNLLEVSTVELVKRKLLNPYVPQWMIDDRGRVVGMVGRELSPHEPIARDRIW